MNPLAFLAYLPLALAAVIGVSSVRITRQGRSVLVERLGTYTRTLEPGITLLAPFVDTPVSDQSLKERVLDVPPQGCITKDNVKISVDAVVYWQIIDHYKSHYAVADLRSALVNLVLTQIRSEVGRMDLDETFSARQEVNEHLLRELDGATDPWGIKVTRVELRDILPSAGVAAAMEKQMTAERNKRATVLNSEAEKESAINVARGRAEALVLDAEAKARNVVLDAEARAQEQKLLAEAQGQATVIDAEARAQEQKLLAEAQAEATARLAAVLQEHPPAAEVLRLQTAKDWMTAVEAGLADSKAGSVLMLDPQSPASLLAALKSLQQKS
ncbi:MAG: paraslipin [Synechococcus sp. SB0673_bin_10]|nr:paraslipin [Synechococcus sp. SB0667_bin_8]MYF19485.1 paraslipin [Synechococcus sp. SB0677_bin_5]MYG64231.1 paraslipin [Synechococcus sp. SB0675_bin_7]MYI72073.1 paraslipin [Synechococcus sp. SB0673_bin_10]MYK84845.1 paraslipin [Synechococcus sp. SB0669_bin_7]